MTDQPLRVLHISSGKSTWHNSSVTAEILVSNGGSDKATERNSNAILAPGSGVVCPQHLKGGSVYILEVSRVRLRRASRSTLGVTREYSEARSVLSAGMH